MLVTTFSQYIYHTQIKIDNKEIIENLKNEMWEITEATSGSDAKCKITKSKNILYKNYCKELLHNCQIHVKNLIKECYSLDQEFKIFSSWGTYTPPNGGFVQSHIHSNSWLSGVYYPDNHPNSSLRIYNKYDNSLIYTDPKTRNQYNAESMDVQVREGNLVLFEANVKHSVLPNYGNSDRFSIAFNVLPVGLFGQGDSAVRLEVYNPDE